MTVPYALAVTLLLMPLGGCSTGCSDGANQHVVEVRVPASSVAIRARAELQLCQRGRCSTIEAPVVAEVLEVAFSDFGPDADVDRPGTLAVVLTGGDDRVIAAQSFDLDFEARATGPGCDRVMSMSVDLT